MVVIKDQRLDGRVAVMALDTRAYGGQLAFVHHFIAFKVEGPVAGAGVLRDHFLLRIDKAPVGHALVPQGFDDADFGVADGLDALQRVVFAFAHGHDKFIDERQQGADGCLKGKAQAHAVANKGKAADGNWHR